MGSVRSVTPLTQWRRIEFDANAEERLRERAVELEMFAPLPRGKIDEMAGGIFSASVVVGHPDDITGGNQAPPACTH